MTLVDFDTYRLVLLNYSSNLIWGISNKIKLGVPYLNDVMKAYVLNKYIDVMLEHTLQTEAAYDVENLNFYTNEEMLELQQKINELINTDYNNDFFLDE